MSTALPGPELIGLEPFHHEAALYSGPEGFMRATLPFIRQALAAQEPVLVAVSDEKISLLRTALGGDAASVRFADMAKLGANPAHIIPAWLEFVAERPRDGARVWGIGEPIGPERSAAALVECQLHESLLNVAFADVERFNLLCPYDTDALGRAVIAQAQSSHPVISREGVGRASDSYRPPDAAVAPEGPPLDAPPPDALELPLEALGALPAVRAFVQRHAAATGLSRSRIADLALAINELVANSFVHGGGRGLLRIWQERDGIICEVWDPGRFADPLAGRRAPRPGQIGGWGLWLANQLCELVQVRSTASGSIVRLHMHWEADR